MKIKEVPSTWLEKEGRRLDCGPYLSGAIEAKVLLEQLPLEKEPLQQLTRGYKNGIYNGPQFARTYVNDPAYGVPFLSSSSMLLADLSMAPLLRRKDAESLKLNFLRIEPGMTLISCSGTIGRTTYARSEMDGLWSSQHTLKVVPDSSKILPGYLYAYLSSRFGFPLIVSGTYGAIIQHIEPHHIADLPVPRLSKDIETHIHSLVVRAATLRTKASLLLSQQRDNLEKEIAGGPVKWSLLKEHSFAIGRVMFSDTRKELLDGLELMRNAERREKDDQR
jgi:type I restriction enzyme S subunit